MEPHRVREARYDGHCDAANVRKCTEDKNLHGLPNIDRITAASLWWSVRHPCVAGWLKGEIGTPQHVVSDVARAYKQQSSVWALYRVQHQQEERS